jgi:dTMP kinase
MIFITFEGSEGSGKSTQLKMLSAFLKKKGFGVIITREPGGSALAEKIRKLLLDKNNNKMTAKTELLLYLASRAQHVNDVIVPALKSGKIVLCDRFHDSTVAYQGYARGMDITVLNMMNSFAAGSLKPDMTIFMDISVKEGLKRAVKAKGCKDRIELEKLSFHKKVKAGYLKIASKEPGRVKVIKSIGLPEEISRKIAVLTEQLIRKKGANVR